ncbi:BPSS1780 family membrane protein [Thiocystis violacea]|uniref:BPSS1780 family membrane protein n=1 Tax=Thiocystis violacea TaxID=13725 RepID=UPI001907201E|nr:BPSS1780 family membrane protein [Thiocystis violacea]MBK1718874.1 hypothetical protein [Thiocystis violacea]
MDARYRILYSGHLMPGQETTDVVDRLARKFRMREDTARELVLNGSGRVLKQSLTAEEAERYRAALTAAGMMISIEPQDIASTQAESELSAYPIPPAAPAGAGAHARSTAVKAKPRATSDGTWSRCPKCGAKEVSDLTGVCQVCGVVVERYLASHGQGGGETPTKGNPYAPPQADLTPPSLDTGADAFNLPRPVAAGRGWAWILEAWELFKQAPGTWIGALLIFYLIIIVISLVPILGGLATSLLGPMLSAGLMMGAHSQYRGEGFAVSQLFAGLSRKPGPLALVGVVYLVFAVLIGLVIGGLFLAVLGSSGFMMSDSMMSQPGLDAMAMGPVFVLPVLFALLLGMPLAMAMVFAPALVALDDVPVMRAFKLSFMGCLKNILPFLVFGLVALVMVVVGALPFFLGWLLVLPILTISIYAAYRDIYYR